MAAQQQIIRLGDSSNHGGTMVSASSVNFQVNGKKVCVNGDMHSCPIPYHGTTAVSSACSVTSGGQPILHVGNVAGCGAVLSSGSPDTTTGCGA